MSWKQVTDLDGTKLVEMQLRQGKLETQKHEDLNHEDPSIQELDECERLQYRRVKKTDSFTTATKEEAERGTSSTDNFKKEPDEEDEKEAELAAEGQQIRDIKKQLNMWTTQKIDLQARVDKHVNKRYLDSLNKCNVQCSVYNMFKFMKMF